MSSSQSESPENYLGRKVVACPTVLVLSCAVCPSLSSSVCLSSYWSNQFGLPNYIKVVIFTIGNKLIVISIVVPAALFILYPLQLLFANLIVCFIFVFSLPTFFQLDFCKREANIALSLSPFFIFRFI